MSKSRSGLDQYYTPKDVADEMIKLAQPENGLRILEPSAGRGALIDALYRAGWEGHLWAYEVNHDVHYGDRIEPARDFLTSETPRFSLCIMNPPYSNGLDLKFVVKALECSAEVVALLRTVVLSNKSWWRDVWSKHELKHITMCGRLCFDGPDTNGIHSRHDYAICLIQQGDSRHQNICKHHFPRLTCYAHRWKSPEQKRVEKAA